MSKVFNSQVKQEQYDLLVEMERILMDHGLYLEDRELAVLHNLQYDLAGQIEGITQHTKRGSVNYSLNTQPEERLKPHLRTFNVSSMSSSYIEPARRNNPYVQEAFL